MIFKITQNRKRHSKKIYKIKNKNQVYSKSLRVIIEIPILSTKSYTFNARAIAKKQEKSKRDLHNAAEIIKRELNGV